MTHHLMMMMVVMVVSSHFYLISIYFVRFWKKRHNAAVHYWLLLLRETIFPDFTTKTFLPEEKKRTLPALPSPRRKCGSFHLKAAIPPLPLHFCIFTALPHHTTRRGENISWTPSTHTWAFLPDRTGCLNCSACHLYHLLVEKVFPIHTVFTHHYNDAIHRSTWEEGTSDGGAVRYSDLISQCSPPPPASLPPPFCLPAHLPWKERGLRLPACLGGTHTAHHHHHHLHHHSTGIHSYHSIIRSGDDIPFGGRHSLQAFHHSTTWEILGETIPTCNQ